jgi:hypothetical protein
MDTMSPGLINELIPSNATMIDEIIIGFKDQASHERIYQMIWDDKRDGGNLWRSLRRRRRGRF